MSSKLFVPALLDGHAVLRKHRRIDLLVNNAGGQYLTPAEDITPEGFRTVIEEFVADETGKPLAEERRTRS